MSDNDIIRLSDGSAIVLILLYAVYLAYTIFSASGPSTMVDAEAARAHRPNRRQLYIALGMLVGATIAVVIMSEILVGALEPTAEEWVRAVRRGDAGAPGWEYRRASGGSTDGAQEQDGPDNRHRHWSGLQIALFVAPVLVLTSQFVGPRPMSLVFNSYELAALIGAVLIAVLISIDGKTNWLEGVQLLALYAIVAIAFYYAP